MLRKIREQRGLSMEAVGKLAGGITRQTVSDIEGDGNPKRDTVNAVLSALGVTDDEVYALIPLSLHYKEAKAAARAVDAIQDPVRRSDILEALTALIEDQAIGDVAR